MDELEKKRRGRSGVVGRILGAGSSAIDKTEGHFKENFLSRFKNIDLIKWRLRGWFFVIFALIILSVVQTNWYNGAFRVESYGEGGDYHEGTTGEIKTLNPLYASSNAEKILAKLLFNGLLGPDGKGNISNVLAETVKREGDGKIWTVKIKDNLKWSDGKKLTIDDVLFTVKLIQDEKTKTVLKSTMSNVKASKINNNTIKFELGTPYAAFTNSLTFPILPKHILKDINPERLYENKFSREPIGSGAFILKTTQVVDGNQTAYLNRNDNYYLKSTKLNSYTLTSYKDNAQLEKAMSDGTIMGTGDLNTLDNKIENSSIEVRRVSLNGGTYAFLNTQSELLSNVEIRRAIQQGVDITKLRDGIADAWPLDFPILDKQVFGINYPKLVAYDKKAAYERLKKIGLSEKNGKKTINGKAMNIRLAVPKRSLLQEFAERMKTQLEELGFTVSINSGTSNKSDSNDFFTSVVQARDYDILIYEIDLGADADPYPYYSSTQVGAGGVNLSNYKNAIMDDLLLSARSTLSKDLRRMKYEKFMTQWVDQALALGICQSHMDYYHVKNSRIFGEDTILQSSFDRYYDINEWAVEKATFNQTP